jgi:hypothetical protein
VPVVDSVQDTAPPAAPECCSGVGSAAPSPAITIHNSSKTQPIWVYNLTSTGNYSIPETPWQTEPPAPAPPQRPAQPPPMQVVGEFGDWAVYSIQEQGGRLCFMTSRPRSSTPATVRRGEIRLMVTHWPSEQTFDEVNFVPGFNFRDASDVTVQIGNDRFSLFTQGDKAWARDAETDRRIVEALRKGARVVVTAVSERGTTTTDTFGLNGSNRAYEEMSRACNVRR